MRIRESKKWKMAFYTRCGNFEYQVISFRVFNASVSFQGYIHKIFIKKLDIFIVMY